MYKEEAFQVFKNSATKAGFLATAVGDENYNRVWSRDSAITALAILLHDYEALYPSIKASILTLGSQQNQTGIIPSNVAVDHHGNLQPSYGTLVGRVDAQTWWVIQSCLFILKTNDLELKEQLKGKIDKVLGLLDAWEFNARDLLYTPLGGNWADEYVLSGYTLYDNLLRFWALDLYAQCWPSETQIWHKMQRVRVAILSNFSIDHEVPTSATIHPRIQQELQQAQPAYMPACFDAAQYVMQWDAAAHGLALLLGFDCTRVASYVQQFQDAEKRLFVPSFWPVIQEEDQAWSLLEHQYNYAFKNKPYHFHNGGSWPVMSGILAMGFRNFVPQLSSQMASSYEQFLNKTDHMNFSEYISTNKLQPGGKTQMCFSAAGYLFMCATPAQIKSIFAK
ncbi:MAG: glycoside hydrolase 100 family protein [Flavobacteriales bacterium]